MLQETAQLPGVAAPPLENCMDPEEEAELLEALDADIAEMRAALASGEDGTSSPADIKAFMDAVHAEQRELDEAEHEAEAESGVLEFDADEPRTLSHAGASSLCQP